MKKKQKQGRYMLGSLGDLGPKKPRGRDSGTSYIGALDGDEGAYLGSAKTLSETS
jgi:hypothetical protein